MVKKFIIRKGKKYMTGHDYCNLTTPEYKFTWTYDKSDARVMTFEMAERFKSLAGGQVIQK